MKHKIVLISVILGLFSNCVYYINQSPHARYSDCLTAECLNDGLIDSSIIDSSFYDNFFVKFMTSVDTSSRSTKVIDSVIADIKIEISKLLVSAIKVDTIKHFFNFCVDPDGTAEIKFHKTDTLIDTSLLQMFNSSVLSKEYKFSPMPGLYTRRGITAKGDSVSVDTANYYAPLPKIKGARSRKSIMEVVMKNISKMRYGYNRRLSQKNGIKGKITVKYAIDHYGGVIFCKVIKSTTNDKILEEMIHQQVKSWKFGFIKIPGDVTEVVYPFVFSQAEAESKSLPKSEPKRNYGNQALKKLKSTKVGPRTVSSLSNTIYFNEEKINSLCCEYKGEDIEGEILFKVKVDYLGKVTELIIENSSINNKEFKKDLDTIVRSIDFMRKYGTKDDTDFSYIFTFNSSSYKCPN